MRHQELFNDKVDLKQMLYLNKVHRGTQSPSALPLNRADGTDLCNRICFAAQAGLYAVIFQ